MGSWERKNRLLEDLKSLEEELCVYELQIEMLLQEAKNMSADVKHLRKSYGLNDDADEAP